MSMLSRLLRRTADEELTVASMKRRDVPEILVIEEVSYPRPWTSSVFLSEIDQMRQGERHYVVARRERDLVGYAGLMFVVGDAHVTNIATSPAHQRSGVATRLLAELAWVAIERQCTALTLEVRTSNAAAQHLYRRFGFAPVGVRQRYYENTEDAIVMWCHDIHRDDYRARLVELCPEAVR